MKKLLTLFAIICVSCFSSTAFADVFSALENISPAQKERLNRVYQKYKFENNKLNTKIMEYNDKLLKLKSDIDKTPEDLAVLVGAYERNLAALKSQQEKLEQEADASYKEILTLEQYEQYKAQQSSVKDAFKNFLPKM